MKIYVIEAQCPKCKVLWKLEVNEGTTEQLCQTCTVLSCSMTVIGSLDLPGQLAHHVLATCGNVRKSRQVLWMICLPK